MAGKMGSTMGGAASGAAAGSAFGPWGTVIGAGVGGIGGYLAGSDQEDAQKAAAEAQRRAAAEAIGTQRPIYDASLGQYKNLLGDYASGQFDPRKFDFKEDPGYQYALKEGQEAIGSQAAGGGMGHSALTTKALMGNATDMANQGYQNAFNRNLLGSQAQFAAGSRLMDPLMPSATNISNLQSGLGQPLSDIAVAQGNIRGQQSASPWIAAQSMIPAAMDIYKNYQGGRKSPQSLLGGGTLGGQNQADILAMAR